VNNREADNFKHPPACNCDRCTKARLEHLGYLSYCSKHKRYYKPDIGCQLCWLEKQSQNPARNLTRCPTCEQKSLFQVNKNQFECLNYKCPDYRQLKIVPPIAEKETETQKPEVIIPITHSTVSNTDELERNTAKTTKQNIENIPNNSKINEKTHEENLSEITPVTFQDNPVSGKGLNGTDKQDIQAIQPIAKEQ